MRYHAAPGELSAGDLQLPWRAAAGPDAGTPAAEAVAALIGSAVDIADITYGSLAEYTLAFPAGQRERVDALLAAATHGSATARSAGYQWVEVAARG